MPIPPSPPKIGVRNAGSLVGRRGNINLLAGTGIARTVTDDPTNNEVEVTLSASFPTGTGARAYNSTDFSHTSSGSWVAVTLNSERYDTDAYHDTGSNTSRLTVPTGFDGKFEVIGSATFAANAVGQRGLQIRLNGSTVIAEVLVGAAATGVTSLNISADYALVATDYVEMLAFQSSGGTLAVSAVSNNSPEFSIAMEAQSTSASAAPADGDYWVETANGSLSAEVVVGTSGITTAAYASRPAAAKAGRLFLPNDGVNIQRDTGSAWEQWGPVNKLVEPVDGDFSWINQGGASVNAAGGGIFLNAPAGSGDNVRARVKTAPSTPYTIDVAIIPLLTRIDFSHIGICFRQSSDGKMVIFGPSSQSGVYSLVNNKMTNSTTFSATYGIVTGMWIMGLIWLRITDDGTNRVSSISMDGINYQQFHTVGRTDFLTADQVGFFANSRNTSFAAALTVISWKQS